MLSCPLRRTTIQNSTNWVLNNVFLLFSPKPMMFMLSREHKAVEKVQKNLSQLDEACL